MSSFGIAVKIRKDIINLLRESFGSNDYFTYSSNKDITQLGIYGVFPKFILPYPVLVVSIGSMSSLPRCFGNDIFNDVYGAREIDSYSIYGSCYQVFGGGFYVPVSIHAYAKTTYERDLLSDWVLTYLRHENKDYFESNSIDFADISRSPENIQAYGADLIYTSSVDILMFAEWEDIVLTNSDLLKDYSLEVETILPDGSCSADDTDWGPVDVIQYLLRYHEGILTVNTIWGKHYFDYETSVRKLELGLRGASTGEDVIIALLKNGTETGDRITLPAGTTFIRYTPSTPITYTTSDYLELKNIQVGSTFPGDGAMVTIYHVQTT